MNCLENLRQAVKRPDKYVTTDLHHTRFEQMAPDISNFDDDE